MREFFKSTAGAVHVDMVMMTGGLCALCIAIVSTLGTSLRAETQDLVHMLSPAVAAPQALCPEGWIAHHAAQTKLSPQEMIAWHEDALRHWGRADVIEKLGAFAAHPEDYRHQQPLALAQVQIALCVAERRAYRLPQALTL